MRTDEWNDEDTENGRLSEQHCYCGSWTGSALRDHQDNRGDGGTPAPSDAPPVLGFTMAVAGALLTVKRFKGENPAIK